MSKEKLHFRFNIGDGKAVCVEGGTGYGNPTMHDSVTLSIRPADDKNKLGAREAVSFYAKRSDMAAIGFAFLDVARNMAPETMWARSEVVAAGQTQQKRIMPLTMAEEGGVQKMLEELGPDLVRSPALTFDNLRARMPILQRMQFLLERADTDLAHQLDLLLSMVEATGRLPFALSLVGMPMSDMEDMPGNAPH
jgi:hypothetical protein